MILFITFPIVFVLAGYVYYLFQQEPNSWSIGLAVIKLEFSDAKMVPIDSDYHQQNKQYITYAKGSNDFIPKKMKQQGWKFQEQMGSAYFFMKDQKCGHEGISL
ncbi:hypothetical protein [Shimazuella kribbensis]|uniref:hypothetical protein n=1 Tax=Shimazuella kribbensis TaxID=139808 RepID=UPI0012EBB5CD|nr:hypothetical protein [Shimazuella kribbensis]